MNLEKMLDAQKKLDERIIKEKGLEGIDLVANTYVALDVELGEMANEARWFKFWSNDQEQRAERLLEEYVDALHFFLSIAIQNGWEESILIDLQDLKTGDFGIVSKEDITNVYSLIKNQLCKSNYLSSNKEKIRKSFFQLAWFYFLVLGVQGFGFTLEQIEQAYFDKNKVNHQRQNNGY